MTPDDARPAGRRPGRACGPRRTSPPRGLARAHSPRLGRRRLGRALVPASGGSLRSSPRARSCSRPRALRTRVRTTTATACRSRARARRPRPPPQRRPRPRPRPPPATTTVGAPGGRSPVVTEPTAVQPVQPGDLTGTIALATANLQVSEVQSHPRQSDGSQHQRSSDLDTQLPDWCTEARDRNRHPEQARRHRNGDHRGRVVTGPRRATHISDGGHRRRPLRDRTRAQLRGSSSGLASGRTRPTEPRTSSAFHRFRSPSCRRAGLWANRSTRLRARGRSR